MQDSPQQTPGQTLGPYTLLGKLGQGGMGEVLLARDSKLGRKVALKVLPEDLRADPDRRTRFLREARAAAQLTHPHVTQIFEVGESEGRDYIAFEYVDGVTLQERIAQGELSVAEIVDLALPLVDAIGYAHERGVVHRDIKGANVMVTERGHPKLLDFGLAKLLREGSQAPASKKATTLTIKGAIFGTPGAMSPEQALGRPVDARSDVFSFGSLLYEMAAGRPAFAGETIMETVDAVINAQPEPLAAVRPGLPEAFIAIIDKATRKDPRERYQTMADLAADLRHFKRQTDSGLVPPAARRGTGPSPKVALLVLAVLVTVVTVANLIGHWLGGEGAAPAGERFVAVMFFDNVTDPGDEERTGVMLAHLLTSELSAAGGLDVLSQQRLFEVARQIGRPDGKVDRLVASEVAHKAGVDTMILGELIASGGRLVATASLVEATSGREIGSFRAEAQDAQDVFALAESLGGSVRELLAPQAAAPLLSLQAQLTSSVDAYRAYVRGRELMMERDPYYEAIDALAEATEHDASFALAHYWRGLGESYMGLTEDAARSFEKAAAFRDELPEEVRATLDLAASYATRNDEATLRIYQQVVEADPDALFAHYIAGEVYIHSPTHVDSEKSIEAFERVLEIDPGFSMVYDHMLLAWILRGQVARARTAFDGWQVPAETEVDLRALVLAAEGRTDEHRALYGDPNLTGHLFPVLLITEEWALLDDAEAERAATEPVAPAQARLGSRGAASILFRGNYLTLRGRFDEALTELEQLPETVEGTAAYGWAGSVWTAGLIDRAGLLLLRGDAAAAHALVEAALENQPDAYRPRYQACLFACAAGELDMARAHVARFEELAELGRSPTAARYRDAARAEVAFAAGDGARARRGYEAVVAQNQMDDWFVSNQSFGPVLRERYAEICLAEGDEVEAAAVLEELLAANLERLGQQLPWIRSLHRLGMLELELGREEAARGHLERYLAAWGDAQWQLPEIAEARAALERLR